MSNNAKVVQNNEIVCRAHRCRYAVMVTPDTAGWLYNALVEFVYRDKGKDPDWVDLFETTPELDKVRDRLFEVHYAAFFLKFYGQVTR